MTGTHSAAGTHSALRTPNSAQIEAPTTLRGLLRHLGPGFIITATIVGSGELIVTPKLGATVGFSLLWFIILGCALKVFVQIQLARTAVATGKTTLEALDSMPGPRWKDCSLVSPGACECAARWAHSPSPPAGCSAHP